MTLAEGSDEDLLDAHRAGDHEAFGILFARHRDRLWAVALRTTGDPEEAADALQDAMIAAFRRADSFRGEARVTTWLHRIVVNACLDRIRRNRVRAHDRLPEAPESVPDRLPGGSGGDPGGDPERAAVREDERAAVLAGLARLPAEQRAALVLVDLEEYSVEEAAAVLECPPGTVKSRCARGRRRLAALLTQAGFGPPAPGTGAVPGASDLKEPGAGGTRERGPGTQESSAGEGAR